MSDRKVITGAAGPGFSRRSVLQMGAAAGIGLSAGGLLLPGGRAFAEETPKQGGRLRIGLAGGQTNNTLDHTGNFGSPADRLVNFTLYNCLVEINPDGVAIPELAESWDIGPDAKRWVFNIRKGVTFHNGKELTADDVVFSIIRHMGPESKSGALGILKELESIKKLDKYQVEIVHKTGTLDLHYMMSDYHLAIVPEGQQISDGTATGPYVLQSYEPGVRFFATRNKDYWKEGRAHLDEVEILIVNDDLARHSALQSGEVNVVNRLDPKTVSLMQRAPGLEVIISDGYGFYTVNMLCDVAPFDNPDLRLAFKYAVDREALLERILRGYGALGNDQPLSEKIPFYDAGLAQRSQDLDKAKYHFEKSGHSGALPLRASSAAFSSAVDMAVLLQEQAAKIGMEIDVVREPPDGYWTNVWRKEPFMISYWAGRATADQMFTTAYYSKAPWNDTHWTNARFDELLLAARTEFDEAKRTQMYAEMQTLVNEDGGAMIPLFNSYLDGAQDSVKGPLKAPNMELAGCRIAERAWLS